MRPRQLRSMVVTTVVVVLAGLGWFYLAPTQIGGSTSYVITHGISMEPLIHADDLVLVRPADNYRVGQVVAYHSTLLHTVILHRIVRIDGGHYFFKGDNNNFIDPTHPTRALLIGTMWLHIAHGGALVTLLHQPWFAALLFGAVAMFVLFGGGQKRRRRDRGRRHDSGSRRARSLPPVTSFTPHSVSRASDRQLFGACIAGALVFAVLTVVAFVRPTHNTHTVRQPYTQTLRFGYHASVQPSPVYPSGKVATGDPVYIQLVHQVTVTAAYRLTTTAPYRLHGTIGIRATLSNTSGWSRGFWLARPTPFVGASARTSALIDLPRFQSLANRISAQIGGADGGIYNLAVTPRVKIAGTIAGQRMSSSYSPTLNLGVGATQLLNGSSAIAQSSSSGGSATAGLVHSTPGTATTVHSPVDTLAGVPVGVLRWLAFVALLLCAWGAVLTRRREHDHPPDPVERINHRYKHLIVPVEPITPSADHPPIEVSSIDALAQLAERSERLILHDHQEDVDNYLIDDQGTLFRFSAPRVTAADMNGAFSVNGTGSPDAQPAIHDTRAGEIGNTETGQAGESSDQHDSEGPDDPGVSDPAADAAAAILSSAAATLSAAAAKATAAPAGNEDASDASDRRSGADRRRRADRRAGADRSASTDRRAATDRRGAADPAHAAETEDDAVPPTSAVNGSPSTDAPAQTAETTQVRGRPTPDLLVLDADPRQPPIPAARHWTSRPEVRVGFTLGPLALCLLAWQRVRARRRRWRGDEAGESAMRWPSKRRSWTTRNLPRR